MTTTSNKESQWARLEALDDDHTLEKIRHIVREEGLVRSAMILNVAPMTLQKILTGSRVRPSTLRNVEEGFNRYYGISLGDQTCGVCAKKGIPLSTIEIVTLPMCEECGLLFEAADTLAHTDSGRQVLRLLIKNRAPQLGL